MEEKSDEEARKLELGEWDTKFMDVDEQMRFDLIMAANYLDIKPLLDIGCKTIANWIKDKVCCCIFSSLMLPEY